MKWTEVQEIAIQLADTHPDVDPMKLNFVDLMNWVMALPDFDDGIGAARAYRRCPLGCAQRQRLGPIRPPD